MIRSLPNRLRRALGLASLSQMETAMSAIDELKAAVVRQDASIAHVKAILAEANERLQAAVADEDEIDLDAIDEVVSHLNATTDQLNALTLAPGPTTGNKAADPSPPTPPVGA